MKVINVDLANDIKTLELVCLSDTHIGDPFANEKALMEQIRYVEDTPNCYAILNGDLMNNGTKSSPTDTYTEAMSPLEQMIKAVTLLKPIADKVLAITQGNHERRTAKESGVDIARLIARELHLEERYSDGMAYIFLRFGDWGGNKHHQPVSYQILADADLYLYGHTHQSMAYREGFYRVNQQKNLVTLVDRLFVNSGAFLDWGGYAEQAQFRPAIISTPHIFLDGTDRKMWVQM